MTEFLAHQSTSRLSKIISHLAAPWGGILLHSYSSEFHPQLDVRLLNGRKVLDSEHANLAWGGLHILFQKTFEQIKWDKQKIKKVLLLGFGAGGVAHVLQRELDIGCSITGIEIDPKLIEIAREYFDFDKLKNTEILISDAVEYLEKKTGEFDLVVVDLFFDIRIPEDCYTDSFRQNLKSKVARGGWLVYNLITRLSKQKKEAEALIKYLNTEGGMVQELKPYGENTIVVWHRG